MAALTPGQKFDVGEDLTCVFLEHDPRHGEHVFRYDHNDVCQRFNVADSVLEDPEFNLPAFLAEHAAFVLETI